MKIIGIAGTNGSGKDSAAELLSRDFGYISGSTSDLLREEARNRGLSQEREVLRTISSEWRQKLGDGALVEKVLETKNASDTQNVVIFSIRSSGEADAIHARGGRMFWIDADRTLRYDRVTKNNRGRTEDQKTFKQFAAEEETEILGGAEAKGLNLSAVKEKCDYFIQNDVSWTELKAKLAEILED